MPTAVYPTLKDRVVVITGGGQALGRTYAHAFAEQGAIPVIAELNEESGQRVANEITQKGGRALSIQTNVADEKSVNEMAEAALSEYGRIDCLVNNAAVFSQITIAPFWELSVEEWQSAMDVNINGAFFCSRAVVPIMQERKWGRIVNIGSINGQAGQYGHVNYAATKSGIHGFTKALAQEGASKGITVNAIAPGYVDTDMVRAVPPEVLEKIIAGIPVGRLGHAEDIARGVVFLTADNAGFITGSTLSINGGQHMY